MRGLQNTNGQFSPRAHLPVTISPCEAITAAERLYPLVGPTNVIVISNQTFATEYESFAWGYPSPGEAWAAVVSNKTEYPFVHHQETFENAGWVKGTRAAHGSWGAYLWMLQNTVGFWSSDTNVWVSPGGVTNLIAQVVVGSMGDYAPMAYVHDVGPTNWTDIVEYLGPSESEDMVYRGDYTAYYRLGMVGVSGVTNFSPHLGETATFEINLDFDPHVLGITNWFFDCQIIRKRKDDSPQIISILDVGPTDPEQYKLERNLNFTNLVLTWNGRSEPPGGEGADAATGPDVFYGVGNNHFHRKLPAVNVGQPVPPPLYHLRARIRRPDGSVFSYTDQAVHVPQVVLLDIDPNALTALSVPLYEEGVEVVQAIPEALLDVYLDIIHDGLWAHGWWSAINVRFANPSVLVNGDYSTITLSTFHPSEPTTWGIAEHTDFANLYIADNAIVYAHTIRDTFRQRYIDSLTEDPDNPGGYQAPPIDVPFKYTEQEFAFERVIAHELGHLLGLVAQEPVLGGTVSGHNPGSGFKYKQIMNDWMYMLPDMTITNDSLEARIGREGVWSWRELNRRYLEFILPHGE